MAIKTEHHADHDRLILEFGGTTAPGHTIKYVSEVREDPSDRPVTLTGTAFLQIVLDGGTLDTSPRESDPNKVERYAGPRRLSPDLPLIKEVAVTGDFEAHLSFGVGLSRKADFKVQTLTAPARVVIQFR
ncbi:MAG TPA: hypothetical protein DGG94_10000 [Micromonosporaceae bacterium]|nr:hypothetical protein [Micromonosporaceae bacterium]HCU50115.1 hypothetical protein [Micromonosporaceae bacterium]